MSLNVQTWTQWYNVSFTDVLRSLLKICLSLKMKIFQGVASSGSRLRPVIYTKALMVTAYKPQITATSYDDIDSNTPTGELPELMDRLDSRGGYDPRTGKLTPFKNISDDFDESLINQMLDSMTAAVEAGLGTPSSFLKDFFATDNDVQNFADALDDYADEGTFWVNDRHFNAFIRAANANEEHAVTYSAMADRIRELFEIEREQAHKAAKSAGKKSK